MPTSSACPARCHHPAYPCAASQGLSSQLTRQIESEIDAALDFLQCVYGRFGFSFQLNLSTRPENYLGSIDVWNRAEASLEVRDCGPAALAVPPCRLPARPLPAAGCGPCRPVLIS